METETDVIGFLTRDGLLYCSEACAARNGRRTGFPIDEREYGSLVDTQTIEPGALCPGCGGEFDFAWPETPGPVH